MDLDGRQRRNVSDMKSLHNVIYLISVVGLKYLLTPSGTNGNNWLSVRSRDITVGGFWQRHESLLTLLCHCSFTWSFSDSGSTCWPSHLRLDYWIQITACLSSLHICVSLKHQSCAGWVEETWSCQSSICNCQTSSLCSLRFSKGKIKMPFLKWSLLVRRRNWKHMAAYKREFKPTTETLRLIEEGEDCV